MPNETETLSPEFIEAQRQRLERLRGELLGAERERVDDVQAANDERGEEAAEFEDRAQDMARDEIRQAWHDVDKPRLANIERALLKIRQGSYGVSDLSGRPIPKARLEVVPEAVLTVDEAARR
jgi:DnaK suppressor protein